MEYRNHPTNEPRKNSDGQATTTEADLASDEMGNNQLEGNDQSNVRNQRKAVPDVKDEADGVVESFRKTEKDFRARKDLGKSEGNDE